MVGKGNSKHVKNYSVWNPTEDRDLEFRITSIVQYVIFSKSCPKIICRNREMKHLDLSRAGIFSI